MCISRNIVRDVNFALYILTTIPWDNGKRVNGHCEIIGPLEVIKDISLLQHLKRREVIFIMKFLTLVLFPFFYLSLT